MGRLYKPKLDEIISFTWDRKIIGMIVGFNWLIFGMLRLNLPSIKFIFYGFSIEGD